MLQRVFTEGKRPWPIEKSHTRKWQNNAASRFLAQPASGSPWPKRHVDGVQKADLEARTVGRVVFPWDADYDADRQETNPAFQYYPWSSCTALAKPTCW